jgi:hypothetical protein
LLFLALFGFALFGFCLVARPSLAVSWPAGPHSSASVLSFPSSKPKPSDPSDRDTARDDRATKDLKIKDQKPKTEGYSKD